MNCQNVRTAIDAASPREPFSETVTTHLAFCESCADYSVQMSALFALMNDVPRVQAPNDFDFRLRARIAQAKAAPAPRGGLSFFTELWQSSFSWGQVGSAMAAIALVVTLSTVYLVRNNQPSAEQLQQVAVNTNNPTVVAPNSVPTPSTVATITDEAPATIRVANRAKSDRLITASYSRPRVTDRPVITIDTPKPDDDGLGATKIIVKNRRRDQPVAELSYGYFQPVEKESPKLAQAIF